MASAQGWVQAQAIPNPNPNPSPNLALGVVAHAGVGLLVQPVERAAGHLRDMGRYRRGIGEI